MQVDASPQPYEDSLESLHDSTIVQRLATRWQCTVLIVDDDDIVRANLSAILRQAHYLVHVAASAEEALRMLEGSRFQVVLIDWQMPGMDGLAFCRTVRREHVTGYIYLMMLTVRAGEQDTLSSRAAGADDHLVKGSSTAQILARMEVARRITRLEHSLRLSNLENRRLSVTDALTAAHNCRYLMKYLPRELARAQRYHLPLAVLCCDIDGFKQVNDRLGHAAGDYVLKEFVLRAMGCIRAACDWLARSGGDEFVVVMPATRSAVANCVANKLRYVLTRPPLVVLGHSLEVTVSTGVVALESHSELANSSAADLLRAADMGLCANKRSGKARVTSASG